MRNRTIKPLGGRVISIKGRSKCETLSMILLIAAKQEEADFTVRKRLQKRRQKTEIEEVIIAMVRNFDT